jgi:hypothetical protein
MAVYPVACMMRLLMSKKVPENKRLRPRELFFVLLGVVTAASLAVLWFRLAPELMQHKQLELEDLTGLGRVVMHPALQGGVLFGAAFGLSAGIATRTASGKDKATWILAAVSVLVFAMLLLSVNALYAPVFISPEAAADDWTADD